MWFASHMGCQFSLEQTLHSYSQGLPLLLAAACAWTKYKCYENLINFSEVYTILKGIKSWKHSYRNSF